MKRNRGFTVIEISLAIVVLIVLATFFIIQRNGLEKTARDQARKTAINAMYYDLVNVYYKDNGYYPRTISRDKLTAVDPSLFTDQLGYTLDDDKCIYTDENNKQATDGDCEYKYKASDCDNDGKCKKFELSVELEAEGKYTKSSSDKK